MSTEDDADLLTSEEGLPPRILFGTYARHEATPGRRECRGSILPVVSHSIKSFLGARLDDLVIARCERIKRSGLAES